MDLLSGWQIAGGLILLIAGLIGVIVWLSGKHGRAKAEGDMQAKVAHNMRVQNDKERKEYADRPASRDELFKRMYDESKH